jgi:sialic acid synthase SpsE
MRIGDFEIGSRTFIIAEIGNNHLGRVESAHEMLDAAADSGVDAVKFQLYTPELLVTADMPVLAHVPKSEATTQRERFSKMRLPDAAYQELANHAVERGVVFLTTPFDRESVDLLDPFLQAYKIASGEANNFGLIDYIKAKNKPILLSTGMCSEAEVDALVERLPADRSAILHCIGSYPTPDDQASLAVIGRMRQRYGLPIGYSDHTVDTLAPIVAVAMGATVIEKHFLIDPDSPAGDRALSITPKQMSRMVEDIRRIESMLGDSIRALQPCEEYGSRALRKCLYASTGIQAGDMISQENTILLRPMVDGAREPALQDRQLRATGSIGEGEALTESNTETVSE